MANFIFTCIPSLYDDKSAISCKNKSCFLVLFFFFKCHFMFSLLSLYKQILCYGRKWKYLDPCNAYIPIAYCKLQACNRQTRGLWLEGATVWIPYGFWSCVPKHQVILTMYAWTLGVSDHRVHANTQVILTSGCPNTHTILILRCLHMDDSDQGIWTPRGHMTHDMCGHIWNIDIEYVWTPQVFWLRRGLNIHKILTDL